MGREEIVRSDVMARRVSAATIPPIECPIRIVWTEGSIVGEGVEEETSMSITFSRSLFKVISCVLVDNSDAFQKYVEFVWQ